MNFKVATKLSAGNLPDFVIQAGKPAESDKLNNRS
jgi:hypothetical protein